MGGGVVTPLPPQQLQHILYTIQQIHTHTLNTITQLLTSQNQQHRSPTPTFHTIHAPRARLLVPSSSPWFGREDDLICALGLGRKLKRKEEGDRNSDNRIYGGRNYGRADNLDLMAREVCGVNHTIQQPQQQQQLQQTTKQSQQQQQQRPQQMTIQIQQQQQQQTTIRPQQQLQTTT